MEIDIGPFTLRLYPDSGTILVLSMAGFDHTFCASEAIAILRVLHCVLDVANNLEDEEVVSHLLDMLSFLQEHEDVLERHAEGRG